MRTITRRDSVKSCLVFGAALALDGAALANAPDTALPDRRIPLPSVPNMRELGGLPVAGGIVTRGQIYRSTALNDLSDADMAKFAALGIKTDYDLRTTGECEQSPDRLPPGVRRLHLDVLRDSKQSAATGLSALRHDPRGMAAKLSDGNGEKWMLEAYRDIVSLPSALASYRSFYLDLADPARQGAVLFHCTTGKDRTGWGAASLLWLLGADDRTVYADYLETNTDLLPAERPVFEAAKKGGLDPALLMPILSVQRSYLEAAVAEMTRRFGSLDSYFRQGLGLHDDTIGALRNRFITAAR